LSELRDLDKTKHETLLCYSFTTTSFLQYIVVGRLAINITIQIWHIKKPNPNKKRTKIRLRKDFLPFLDPNFERLILPEVQYTIDIFIFLT